MSRKLYSLGALLIVGSLLLAACGGSSAGEGTLVCQVTDTGGIDDASFNQTAWNGVEQAIANLGIEGQFLESQEQADYETNINAFIDQGCDLIITVGFLLGDATAAAAVANPDQTFGIIDVNYLDFSNVTGHDFATDQAAFLAGYIAAETTQTGIVGTFGGINIPPVTVFMDGFWYGVQYYNNENGTDVQVLGWDPAAQDGLFTGNFDSLDDGRAFAESLMDEGADIIMPVAGPVGLGSAAAVQERGNAWLIGVDSDWTKSAPEYADIVLTSVLKNMDETVYQQIENVIAGTPSGALIVGNLENGGVGIAGDFDVQSLIDGIVAGTIQTAP
ncbi:MAG: BMP family ABC transporter substrate-binding protein [Chloroflexi bacterium]|nr:BMP family ABC transporter substrate-binding protein [Chloroflexota bacterium]MQC26739.1 BMP family ABC transporter substrate-binding protein [Chloroflexota bacterium]